MVDVLKNSFFILFFLFIQITCSPLVAQTAPQRELQSLGTPLIQNFLPKEYSTSLQNWAITQSLDGLIYIGNNNGVLEYDGISWRLIQVNGTTVRSLKTDPETGRIYVGVIGDFGYLGPDEYGNLSYYSLLDKIPEIDKDFADIWNIHITSKGIIFHSMQKMFRYDGNSIKAWYPKKRFHFSFQLEERIFVREPEIGLLELVEDELKPLSGGEVFKKNNILFLLPWPSTGTDTFIIGSRELGLMIYSENKFIRFETEADEQLRSLYQGQLLNDGRLAVGTLQFGVVILDQNGDWIHHLNKANGLVDNAIYQMYQDREDALWLATDRGISRVEIANPLTKFNQLVGLEGQVLSVAHHNNQLFIGTSIGLYRLVSGPSPKFERIPGIGSLVMDILSTHGRLLVTNVLGVFEVIESQAIKITAEPIETTYSLLPQPGKTKQILVSNRFGLNVLRLEGNKWKSYQVKSIKDEMLLMEFDSADRIWLTSSNKGITRVSFPEDWPDSGQPKVKHFNLSHGLNSLSNNVMVKLSGVIYFVSGKRILKFNEKEQNFIPAENLERLFEKENSQLVRAVEQNELGYWMTSIQTINEKITTKYALVKVANENTLTWNEEPLAALRGVSSEKIYLDHNNILWLCTVDGLYRYKYESNQNYKLSFDILLRRVVTGKGRKLFMGAGLPRPIELPYTDNRLRFEFAATSFNGSEFNRYQVKLDGADQEWSQWSKEAFKDYSNLWEGSYRLLIRAKNREGNIIEKESIALNISPPWFRNYLAYFIYITTFIFTIFLIYRWRLKRYRYFQKILKRKVVERTKELNIAYKKMEAISVTDALTGLKNRHFIERYMQDDISKSLRDYRDKHLQKSSRTPHNFDHLFFLIDIDFFKSVNDTYGHDAGDKILVQIKKILSDIFRSSDYLVRWGGEEFLAVARFTERKSASMLAERIRECVESYDFDIGDGRVIRKTCSIGFACFPFLPNQLDSLTWQQVVNIADQCLYAAKKTQRNAWVGVCDINEKSEKAISEKVQEYGSIIVHEYDVDFLTSISAKKSLLW